MQSSRLTHYMYATRQAASRARTRPAPSCLVGAMVFSDTVAGGAARLYSPLQARQVHGIDGPAACTNG